MRARVGGRTPRAWFDSRLPLVPDLAVCWLRISPFLPPAPPLLDPPPVPTGAMLQKIKLMLHLEIIALQRNLTSLEQQQQAEAADEMLLLAAAAAPAGGVPVAAASAAGKVKAGALQALRGAAARVGSGGGMDGAGVGSGGGGGVPSAVAGGAPPSPGSLRPQSEEQLLWGRRLEQVQVLLGSVTTLHAKLAVLCERAEVSVLAACMREWRSIGKWPSE